MTEVNGVILLERKMNIEIPSLTLTLTETFDYYNMNCGIRKIF